QGGAWYILWANGMLVAVLTAFYMTRLFVLTFMGKPRWDDGTHPHESPSTMTIPLIVLAGFTVFFGLVNTPFRLAFEHFLEPAFHGIVHPEALDDALIWTLAAITLVLATGGIIYGWRRYSRDPLPVDEGGWWDRALAGFGVDDFFGRVIVAPGKRACELAADTDAKVIDGVAHGIAIGVRDVGTGLKPVQSGKVRAYAGILTIGGIALIVAMVIFGGGI
ncbi:MAG: hypothetical protein DWP92_03285, partial [Armatimonadetes bacterium]